MSAKTVGRESELVRLQRTIGGRKGFHDADRLLEDARMAAESARRGEIQPMTALFHVLI